mmetsp:Transcript_11537/g.14777  ORF Transcript_11537/g.14777 Transcript_11537/m.14777 type:complete len:213 (-) Transcript_11537:14-652(-)
MRIFSFAAVTRSARGLMRSSSPSSSAEITSGSSRESSPFGPFAFSNWPSIVTVVPDGTEIGSLPIRDILVHPSPRILGREFRRRHSRCAQCCQTSRPSKSTGSKSQARYEPMECHSWKSKHAVLASTHDGSQRSPAYHRNTSVQFRDACDRLFRSQHTHECNPRLAALRAHGREALRLVLRPCPCHAFARYGCGSAYHRGDQKMTLYSLLTS